jgi:hypothetical protein
LSDFHTILGSNNSEKALNLEDIINIQITSLSSVHLWPSWTKKSAGQLGFSPSQNSGKSQLLWDWRQTCAISRILQMFKSQQSPSAHCASLANLHSLAMQHLFGHAVTLPQSQSSPSSKIPFPHLAPPKAIFGIL